MFPRRLPRLTNANASIGPGLFQKPFEAFGLQFRIRIQKEKESAFPLPREPIHSRRKTNIPAGSHDLRWERKPPVA
jgi:hypothetical protein